MTVCAALTFAAVFLAIGIPEIVSERLKGTWYDKTGKMGYIIFNSQSKAEWYTSGLGETDDYTFDGNKVTITTSFSKYEFTCDGNALSIDGTTFVKE